MEIVFSSATSLAAAIGAREVSALEVLEAHLAQIGRHNSALNAVVILDAEGSRRRAREADEALARGKSWGPLHGVPFTLKDAFAAKGMRGTVGFPPFDHVPAEDSTVAARLKAAGGILIGKTNVATMLADYQSSNPIFGRTSNPWNLERTPGGSSGGAAAAVAAGMTPFEIGTDLSSSIRTPAHFCGVFGLKPTERRVSLAGVVPDPLGSPRPLRIMSCVGPLARSIDDLGLIYSIIAGPDGRDTELQPVPAEGMTEVALRGLRVAVAPTFPGFATAEAISGAVRALADELASRGATVAEAALPARDFNRDLSKAGELIGMTVGAFRPSEQPTTLAQYLEALHRRDQSIAAWEQFFEDWDALLCPPCGTTAFPHCEPGSPLRVDGREVEYWSVSAYGTVFNYSGHPAIVIPFGLDSAGLPLGLQLIGRLWSESRLLGLAKAIAEVTPGFQRPPGF